MKKFSPLLLSEYKYNCIQLYGFVNVIQISKSFGHEKTNTVPRLVRGGCLFFYSY
ncbi:hypothetical protein CHCC20335_0848 [Bacillus paralicheniformis]|nr:hypothetical protein CHCC20335_0848 [Bacillus paralicheniformis]